ncbi:hypothetical protein [Ruminobacter amylophilus]|uniref:hypothetical protein n=1 Tax=Ruminobacter amylophilus TaxID=867 RepID=UPI0038663923
MSEPLMSVAGQLIGIPAEKYSGTNGVTVDQNNKTIGLDETVLYEHSTGASTFSTSEAIENFKEVHFYINGTEPGDNAIVVKVIIPMGFTDYSSALILAYNSAYNFNGTFALSWTTKYTRSGNTFTLSTTYFGGGSSTNPVAGANNYVGYVRKVVGINRIGGNA